MMNSKVLVTLAVVVTAVLITACTPSQTSREPVKIGWLGPLSQDVPNIGEASKAAVEIAVEEINANGGINGRPVNVIYEDTKCNPKTASNAARKLVNVDDVTAIVGAICSSATLSAAPIAENAGVPMMSPGSSSPDITDAGDYIFRDYPSDAFQGKQAAKIARDRMNASTAAVLHCQSDYCVAIADVFTQQFKELGGSIPIEQSFPQGSTDLRAQLTKIKEADPDLIYFVSYSKSGIAGLNQIAELGIDAKILGGEPWDDPSVADGAGEAAEGALFLTTHSPSTPAFAAKIENRSGHGVKIATPQSYDAMKIFAQVMRDVGTNQTAMKERLYDVDGYDGISGNITLDANGDLATATYDLNTFRNGTSVVLQKRIG